MGVYVNHNHVPELPCRMCGKESTMCYEYAHIHKEAQVCNRCAELVANVYHMKHGGEWLTWPNPEIDRAREKLRRPLKARVRKSVFERDAYRCVFCQSYENLEVDHIHPVSKGGSDELSNLQTLCKACNSKKRDTIIAANHEE